MEKTYLFYDIETTGLNKCFDQVIQFAAIRTDLALKELERYECYIKINQDVLPSPMAFITHRISLSTLEEKGVNELEAMVQIHKLFNIPGTISVGYNTLRFDDEFLRFSFYRNLLPPYTHQYANGCSRMDIYPMTVMYHLYKKERLNWPENNLKLENISRKNNFADGAAHNAMTDVIATLNLARCLHQDIKVWDYLIGFFDKQIDQERYQQLVGQKNHHLPIGIMIDGKFGPEQNYQCAVTPIGTHHHYKNQQLWLRLDFAKLNDAKPDDFIQYTHVISKKTGEPGLILPMKTRFLQPYLIKQQPFIVEMASRLTQNKALFERISSYYQNYTYPKVANLDVGAGLYENGFLSYQDQNTCKQIHQSAPQEKMAAIRKLSEFYLQELGIRMIGRHFHGFLNQEEKKSYQEYINLINSEDNHLSDYVGRQRFTRKIAFQEIQTLLSQQLDNEQQLILKELSNYYTL